MNSNDFRQSPVSFSRSRRALVQPRVLLATMAVVVSGFAYLATAQTGRSPVKVTPASPAAGSGGGVGKPKSWADLPAMVEAYGQSRLLKKTSNQPGAGQPGAGSGSGARSAARTIGSGTNGFNLVESDLTPNSNSDEREPVVAPGGDFIAFASTGKDSNRDGQIDADAPNADGKYHLWVMNRDGSNQRQVTGLFDDNIHNQRRPTWSPDSNQLAYIDGDGGESELFVTQPLVDADGGTPGTQVNRPSRRTFFNPAFGVTLLAPTWSPSGQSIVFAANSNLDGNTNPDGTPGVVGRPFNLFSIDPTGDLATLVRLTGGSGDVVAGSSDTNLVNDLNPAFSVINANVLYFSSNRTTAGFLAGGGRRIWRLFVDGTSKRQVTDPLRRVNNGNTVVGTINDIDDFPAVSLGGGQESVAFQSNSSIDTSDVDPNGARDFNVWTLPLSSAFPPPFVETEPRVFISGFSSNTVDNANPLTGGPNNSFQGTIGLNNPEGVVVLGPNVYVANRGTNQIFAFDQEVGRPIGLNGSVTPPGSVPSPAGMISDGQYFYVAAGILANPRNTTSIYRFTINGVPAGNPGIVPGSNAAFTFGETAANGGAITDGTEGLAFSTNREFIFASIFSDNKVNVYRTSTGQFVRTLVLPAAGGLAGPTGLTLGPDINGDGFDDLYVNSSNSDDVIAYAGPNPAPGSINALVGPGSNVVAGSFIAVIVNDDNGTQTNLNAPEGIQIIQNGNQFQIFVSSFLNLGATTANPGTGNHLNRYLFDPVTRVATPAGRPPFTNGIVDDASFIRFTNAVGTGYFAFNQLATDSLASPTGMPAPTPVPVPVTTPVEQNTRAQVATNILSSPANYTASGIAPKTGPDNVGQDKSDDLEPAFSRTGTTVALASRIAFASNRRYAPLPASNVPDANGNPPAPANPFGADFDGGTHDIWSTTITDTTPPILIPQAAGNQLYPVVAPGPQSPFFAPRTAETGLRVGGPLTVAVVLSDLESGLVETPGTNVVTALFFRAGKEQFTRVLAPAVNESLNVSINVERRPLLEAAVALQPYDDGPVSSGGHEAQAGAISGDGVYYCVGTTTTPTAAGDFYMDIQASDRTGNNFLYDNVWGFSTQTFAKQSITSGLFVSDYTTGQQFPLTLAQNFDTRFVGETSVESYYLTNNGGQIVDPTVTGLSAASSFVNVDVWRVLSRGQIPQAVFDAYKPRITQQIDPDPTKDPTFTKRTRELPVADSFIAWAAPFAANSFVSPGTITDATMQSRLTNFLDAGGRFFLTGRDVAFALSNGATASNDFLGSELGANFSGEDKGNVLALVGGIPNGFIAYPVTPPPPATFFDLQVADDLQSTSDKLSDAALTQDPTQTGGLQGYSIDIITPNGNDTTPVYTLNGGVVGQKIAHIRANGFQSRVVFFSFGLEAINNRYHRPSQDLPLSALDVRARIAAGLQRYFKTNGVRGNVRNDKTDQPIANFLVRVSNGTDTFLARTDAAGTYELTGIPQGGYTVEPAFLLNGALVARNTPGAQTSPAGFFGGTAINIAVAGGSVATANLRPIPITPGTISGRIVTSKGTLDFKDDLPITQKAVGMTVLLRSLTETSASKNGGRFALLTKTNFNGNFTFSNVPAGIELEVVFNPRLDDPATPNVDENDIPIESGLRSSYSGPNSANGAPKLDVGRRVLPDVRRPDTIIAPVGNTFFLNDPDPAKFPDPTTGPAAGSADADKPADSGVPIVIPEGANVSGLVTLNGAPFDQAKVELLSSTGAVVRTRKTSASGLYSFVDIVPGTYSVKVTATLPDGLEVVRTSASFTVAIKDTTINFPLFLAKVTGLVTLNGTPQSGAFVQLLDATGKVIVINQSGGPFNLVRTATTDNGIKANYTLNNVPAGKYTVKASLSGASGTATVVVTDSRDAVVPTINLSPQKLSGVVNLRIDGVSKGGLSGATVELLDGSGKSLNPPVTTVSGDKGIFGFDFISAGDYKVRASYKGDTDISATFSLRNGSTPNPTLTIDLQTVTVTVFSPQGAVQSGATVTLLLGGQTVKTATTGSNGQVKFTEIAAGTYTITATKDDTSQTATNVVVVEGRPLSISLQLVITGGTGVTFGLNGLFPISLPFATDSVGLTVDQAFNLPLSSKAYRIFYFDAARQINKPRIATTTLPGDFKEITSGGFRLVRGFGYVLQTFNTQVSTRTQMQNAALKPFVGTSFPIPLTWNDTFLSNTGERDNRNNGYNLIGFPFDPARYRSVAFGDAQVVYGNVVYKSLAEAAAAGIISRQVYTVNPAGVRVTTSDTSFKPFVGYFVRILRHDQPIKLILQNPK